MQMRNDIVIVGTVLSSFSASEVSLSEFFSKRRGDQ